MEGAKGPYLDPLSAKPAAKPLTRFPEKIFCGKVRESPLLLEKNSRFVPQKIFWGCRKSTFLLWILFMFSLMFGD